MSHNAKRAGYPYSRNRVILSAIIAILSMFLAITLLLDETSLLLYFFFSTLIVAAITFFIKKRLYPLLVSENLQSKTEKEKKLASWKTLLITASMLIGSILIPLLLARVLSGPAWIIMITSFMSGVSISEIVLYIKASSKR